MAWIWGLVIAVGVAGAAAAICLMRGRRAVRRERDTLGERHRAELAARETQHQAELESREAQHRTEHEAMAARHRAELEAQAMRHGSELAARDAQLAGHIRDLDAVNHRLADCIEGASACAHALEVETKRSHQLANQVDQLAGQLEAERAEAAARLRAAEAAEKAARTQAESLGRALDEIRRIVDAAKVSLGEAGTALDQIRVSAANAGNGGEPAAAPSTIAEDAAPKAH